MPGAVSKAEFYSQSRPLWHGVYRCFLCNGTALALICWGSKLGSRWVLLSSHMISTHFRVIPKLRDDWRSGPWVRVGRGGNKYGGDGDYYERGDSNYEGSRQRTRTSGLELVATEREDSPLNWTHLALPKWATIFGKFFSPWPSCYSLCLSSIMQGDMPLIYSRSSFAFQGLSEGSDSNYGWHLPRRERHFIGCHSARLRSNSSKVVGKSTVKGIQGTRRWEISRSLTPQHSSKFSFSKLWSSKITVRASLLRHFQLLPRYGCWWSFERCLVVWLVRMRTAMRGWRSMAALISNVRREKGRANKPKYWENLERRLQSQGLWILCSWSWMICLMTAGIEASSILAVWKKMSMAQDHARLRFLALTKQLSPRIKHSWTYDKKAFCTAHHSVTTRLFKRATELVLVINSKPFWKSSYRTP